MCHVDDELVTVRWLLQACGQEKQFNICELWKSFNFILQFYPLILQLSQRYFSSIISNILCDNIFPWIIVYKNICLGNTYYNFCYSASMLNIRSRGFDRDNTVLLDIWSNMLIKFSKQIASTFAKIINGYKGEFKTLSNIWDVAFSASCNGFIGELRILPSI